jgi:NADH dehydrogenase FAD-containing subunit
MSAAPTSDRVSADHAAYTGPHRIVGGGAGGLELATRLGDTLGRRGLAHVTLIDDDGAPVTAPYTRAYDTLVIAVGSRTNDFGTPGVAEHAIGEAALSLNTAISPADHVPDAPRDIT